MKVLAVYSYRDDGGALIDSLKELYPGAEIIPDNDGMSAVKYAFNHPVDAVYTYLMMPRISGFDVARLVRKVHPQAKAYLIDYSDKYVSYAEGKNLNGYYITPISAEALRQQNLLTAL